MSLSTSTVIHFTKEFDVLKQILAEGFKPKLCKESFILDGDSYEFFVPMISFCDIPLSQIKDHISKYGCYGIGLSKSWAKKNKLNPVFYIDKDSSISSSLTELVELVDKHEISKFESVDIFRFLKNYEGHLIRTAEEKQDYRFADEREWRYVTPIKQTEHPVVKVDDKESREIINNKLSQTRIKFDANDVRYIIINNGSELQSLISHLRESFKSSCNLLDFEILTTRIFTYEQIMQDL